ncbi:MAG: alpha/beta hydrolase [Actinomycetota bacterium]
MADHPDLGGVVEHRTLAVNGIELHVALAGPEDGELVLLQHGWPECWYSWRHQITALAEAGYRVAAPDGRGYNTSSCPEETERYTVLDVVGDLVGVVGALGREQATLVGHDWGSLVTWPAALLRPDMFHAVCGMSVPYSPGFRIAGMPGPPMEALAMVYAGQFHYMLFFQQPDAHEDLDANAESILRTLYTDPGVATGMAGGTATTFSESLSEPPATTPAWLSEEDLAVYLDVFRTSGFRGGLNWYRNFDRSNRLLSAWADLPITVPSSFIAGALDSVVAITAVDIEAHPERCTDFHGNHLIPGAGHWVQQEAPEETNRLLLEFLDR